MQELIIRRCGLDLGEGVIAEHSIAASPITGLAKRAQAVRVGNPYGRAIIGV
jgi:hypothetical protein